MGDVAITNLREISFCDVLCPVVDSKATHSPLHIAISYTDPNFADKDVFYGKNFGGGRDGESIGSTCFWCFDSSFPVAVAVGFCGVPSEFPGPTEGDGFIRLGGSPDGCFALLLQDHPVLED